MVCIFYKSKQTFGAGREREVHKGGQGKYGMFKINDKIWKAENIWRQTQQVYLQHTSKQVLKLQFIYKWKLMFSNFNASVFCIRNKAECTINI